MFRPYFQISSDDAYLPYYVGLILIDTTRSGSKSITVIAALPEGARNKPLVSRRVYVPSDFFSTCNTVSEFANVALHRMRYYTRKMEGRYDYEQLVINCRPWRGTHKSVLSSVSKQTADFPRDWQSMPEYVNKLRADLAKHGINV